MDRDSTRHSSRQGLHGSLDAATGPRRDRWQARRTPWQQSHFPAFLRPLPGARSCTPRPPFATTTRRACGRRSGRRGWRTSSRRRRRGRSRRRCRSFSTRSEGEHGVLYGHLAKANPQWRTAPIGEALAIFMGPDAYVTPRWYATKRETGKVVPTWNYVTVHAYGPVEFFEDADRLLEVVTPADRPARGRPRAEPWAVADAPRGLRRRAARGHRRPAHADHAARGQAQDEPEPQRRGPRRRGRRARRERPGIRSRRSPRSSRPDRTRSE